MTDNDNWPFPDGKMVVGMPLPEYLYWAAGGKENSKKLLLPAIQRGFVWKPKKIVELWDSLLRGMPIGSFMVTKLSKGQKAKNIGTEGQKLEEVETSAIGLLDGQQRTLAMLLGLGNSQMTNHKMWIDLSEAGQKGSPFQLRITTRTQPFGYNPYTHDKLSRHDRRDAREAYNEEHPEHKDKPDYELFERDNPLPRPWKHRKKTCSYVLFNELWKEFRELSDKASEKKFIPGINEKRPNSDEKLLTSLLEAFRRIKSIEVPLILIPEHISLPKDSSSTDSSSSDADVPATLTLLFERIGRSGEILSSEDLLFSMIKQQWPEAHELVENIHSEKKVGSFMSATDYVMTAYRLAAAEKPNAEKPNIEDNPRPRPRDFHRHLGSLIVEEAPLRNYLENNTLTSAFGSLFDALEYKGEDDIGLPVQMLPHLSKKLIHVLLRWFMVNKPNKDTIEKNRASMIAFALFWHLCIENEDKASKEAFKEMSIGDFPGRDIYRELTKQSPDDGTGLAMPLLSPERLEKDFLPSSSSSLRTSDKIFTSDADPKLSVLSSMERKLYRRFFWHRKTVLLWLQRKYLRNKYDDKFHGISDEDAVPYDYDHLCPQNHWGADWRNISKNSSSLSAELIESFKHGRSSVGNCIGNLHILDSSLNRSFRDDSLEDKLESSEWTAEDSLLYFDEVLTKELWIKASPKIDEAWVWSEERLQAFQDAVYIRARKLYLLYHSACKVLVP